jgi:hypothetical protein
MQEVLGFYQIPADDGKIKVVVRQTPLGLEIAPQGYGDNESEDGMGTPIYLEYFGGELRLHVFGDINSPSPTHTISLAGAMESSRAE